MVHSALLPSGLTVDGPYVVRSALKYGVQITGVNGYGTPLEGYLKYNYSVPDGKTVKTMEVQIDCMWGNVFNQSQQYLNMIKMMNGQVVSYQPTSFNGYGKPCSAEIGYVQ